MASPHSFAPQVRLVLDSLNQQRTHQFEQARLDEAIRQRQAQQDYQQRYLDHLTRTLESQDAARFTDLSPLAKLYGMDDVDVSRVPTSTAPAFLTRMQAQQEEARAARQADAAGQAIEERGTTTAEGIVPEGQYGPGSPVTTVDPRAAFLAKLVRSRALTPKDALADELKPEEAITLSPGQTAVGKRSGRVLAEGGAPKPKVEVRAGKGDTYAVTLNPETGEIIGEPRALGIGATESKGVLTQEHVERALADRGWRADMPGYWPAYVSVARQLSVPPGGAVFGAGDLIVPPPPGARPSAPAPAGQSVPTPRVERPALPNPGEREDIANLDAAEQQIKTVIESLRRPGGLGAVMGGIAKNPKGARARFTEEYLGFGMTDEQRQMMGTLAIQLQAIKHALIGATRTRPELADIAAAIPNEKSLLRGDSAEQAIQKLEATLKDLQTKRSARENTMRSTGVAVPARPSMPSAVPGARPLPMGGWKIERVP